MDHRQIQLKVSEAGIKCPLTLQTSLLTFSICDDGDGGAPAPPQPHPGCVPLDKLLAVTEVQSPICKMG